MTGADIADLGTSDGRRVLWVTRAGGRRQALPLPGPAAARIDAYLAAPGRPGTGQVLFATGAGRRLFPADVRRTVHRLAARAGLPADLARHLGPRSDPVAPLYMQAGGPSVLQHAMGHTDPRTTRQQYTPAGQPEPPPLRSARQAQAPASWPRGKPHCRARRPYRAASHTQRLSRPRSYIRPIVRGEGRSTRPGMLGISWPELLATRPASPARRA